MGLESLSLLLAASSTLDHADKTAIWVTIVSATISAGVAWLTVQVAIRGDERRAIREGNMRLIELAIQYPFLESDDFCSRWPNVAGDKDDAMRYENFCCHVFNLIQHCFEFCRGDLKKMKPILYPDELLWRHRLWWQGDDENQNCYPIEFRTFVADRLRILSKEKSSGS